MSPSMRLLFSLLSALLSVVAASQTYAQTQPRLAVIPYLTLNLTPEEERELREVLSLEIASSTSARLLSSKEVLKLPPLPDGCPENPTCVASVATPLGADYLLFVALIKNGTTIDLQLFLVEVAGVGTMRHEKMSIEADDTTWNESIGGGVRALLGGVKRLAKEANALSPITTQPTTIFIEKPSKDRKVWPWLLIGGALLSGAAASAAIALYPFTSLGTFGPGVKP
jgi:hypothetical protein